MATVIEQLRAAGTPEDEVDRAAVTLAKALPLGRAIVLDDQIVAAARAGDIALLQCLLAPEEPPTEEELLALRELDANPKLRETVTSDEVRRELGLE